MFRFSQVRVKKRICSVNILVNVHTDSLTVIPDFAGSTQLHLSTKHYDIYVTL